jgi:DNA-binding NarL/FixJ family response regulator
VNDSPRAPLRVLIVDDHTVVRAGLRALLTGEPGFDVVGETGDGAEAVRLAARLRPDVVLMDLRLTLDTDPGDRLNGLDATRRIVAGTPGTRVVVLTSYSGQGDVLRAMEAGARGYILKAGPPEELFRAVRAAAAGGMGLAPEVAGHLAGPLADPGTVLSEREIQVWRGAAATAPSPPPCTSPRPRSRPTWSASTASWARRTGRARCRRPSAGGCWNSADPPPAVRRRPLPPVSAVVSGRPPVRTPCRTGPRPRSPPAPRAPRSSSASRSTARCVRWTGRRSGR